MVPLEVSHTQRVGWFSRSPPCHLGLISGNFPTPSWSFLIDRLATIPRLHIGSTVTAPRYRAISPSLAPVPMFCQRPSYEHSCVALSHAISKWLFQLNLESSMIPRYLAPFTTVISLPHMVRFSNEPTMYLLVKSTAFSLLGFTASLSFLHHFSMIPSANRIRLKCISL